MPRWKILRASRVPSRRARSEKRSASPQRPLRTSAQADDVVAVDARPLRVARRASSSDSRSRSPWSTSKSAVSRSRATPFAARTRSTTPTSAYCSRAARVRPARGRRSPSVGDELGQRNRVDRVTRERDRLPVRPCGRLDLREPVERVDVAGEDARARRGTGARPARSGRGRRWSLPIWTCVHAVGSPRPRGASSASCIAASRRGGCRAARGVGDARVGRAPGSSRSHPVEGAEGLVVAAELDSASPIDAVGEPRARGEALRAPPEDERAAKVVAGERERPEADRGLGAARLERRARGAARRPPS